MTIDDAIKAWCEYRRRCANLGLVQFTTHHNQTQIAQRIIEGLGTLMLADLRKSDIDLWMGERLQTHAPITVRGEINVLRQFLNWCVDEQLLGARPRLPTVQVPATEQALPSDRAFTWALRSVPERHRHALEFMMLTGLSPHEAERLQVRDFSPAKMEIGIGQRPDFKVKTPSRRRCVPMNVHAFGVWKKITAGLRPLDAALPSSCSMQRALARARSTDKRVPPDAKRVTPKMMRQWFASKVSDDTPEHVLQRLMGHSPGSKMTRKHYTRSNDERLKQAVGGLGV